MGRPVRDHLWGRPSGELSTPPTAPRKIGACVYTGPQRRAMDVIRRHHRKHALLGQDEHGNALLWAALKLVFVINPSGQVIRVRIDYNEELA